MKGPTILLSFGTIFTVIALALVAVSFATDHWLDTTVDRSGIRDTVGVSTTVLDDMVANRLYFTRYRGLFRTCYPGNETQWLDTASHRVDGWCLTEQGYQLSRDASTLNYVDAFEIRIHLMRSHFAFYVVSMLMLVVAAILSGVGCWTMQGSIVKAAGAVVAIGAFMASGGIAFFHGYEYLENTKITNGDFYARVKTLASYQTLVDNSDTMYGYSYILGWVGVGCAFIAAILCLCTGFSISQGKRDEEKKALANDNYTLSNSGIAPRNKAYEQYADEYAAQAAALGGAYPSSALGGSYPYGYDYAGYRY